MEKTANGLVAYAIAQLGRPYWYGTFGQGANESLHQQKKNQYPNQYAWEYLPEEAGLKVHDCVGLVKGYLWGESTEDTNPVYNAQQDKSANGMYAACPVKGDISTMPEIPGVLVFKNHHMGVYVGNGEVVEARSRRYGVVKTKLTDRAWKNWGYCPYISYEQPAGKSITMELPVLKKGAKGDTVKAMQLLLLGYGYTMGDYGADGSFGGATDRALRAYQGENALDADGSCGRKTWSKLLGLE